MRDEQTAGRLQFSVAKMEMYVSNGIAVKLQTLFVNTSTLIYINLNVGELQYRLYLVQDGVQANALKRVVVD